MAGEKDTFSNLSRLLDKLKTLINLSALSFNELKSVNLEILIFFFPRTRFSVENARNGGKGEGRGGAIGERAAGYKN